MLDFRKEPVVAVALTQLSMASHTVENISMTNFRPESLHSMHLCMGRTGWAARHLSLKLLCIFLWYGYPDNLEEWDGKSVVPSHICIIKASFRFFICFTYICNRVSDTSVLGCLFFLAN